MSRMVSRLLVYETMVPSDSVSWSKPAVSLCKAECGEELFVSYGPHTNDFLLVECMHVSDASDKPPTETYTRWLYSRKESMGFVTN